MPAPIPDEHTLEFLLAFDGRIHTLEEGYWLKFEIKRAVPTTERPHGLRYSFTLHDRTGRRLVGFDNAHAVMPVGASYQRLPLTYDHWHRTSDDVGRPYRFTTADRLLTDFEFEVERVLDECGLDNRVIGERDVRRLGSL